VARGRWFFEGRFAAFGALVWCCAKIIAAMLAKAIVPPANATNAAYMIAHIWYERDHYQEKGEHPKVNGRNPVEMSAFGEYKAVISTPIVVNL
jgi:hypothetical protein